MVEVDDVPETARVVIVGVVPTTKLFGAAIVKDPIVDVEFDVAK